MLIIMIMIMIIIITRFNGLHHIHQG